MSVLVEADPCQTVREVAQELDVDPATFFGHLPQIGNMKKLSKWVPHRLNESQINRHYEVCFVLLFKNKPFLYRIVTCHEKWIVYNNCRQSSTVASL
jgi:histone-lysine N-methyltransferase SETMAR